jgi:hypothetical protein
LSSISCVKFKKIQDFLKNKIQNGYSVDNLCPLLNWDFIK